MLLVDTDLPAGAHTNMQPYAGRGWCVMECNASGLVKDESALISLKGLTGEETGLGQVRRNGKAARAPPVAPGIGGERNPLFTDSSSPGLKQASTATGVEIRIPVPSDADSPQYNAGQGTVRYIPEDDVIVWSLKSFQVTSCPASRCCGRV